MIEFHFSSQNYLGEDEHGTKANYISMEPNEK